MKHFIMYIFGIYTHNLKSSVNSPQKENPPNIYVFLLVCSLTVFRLMQTCCQHSSNSSMLWNSLWLTEVKLKGALGIRESNYLFYKRVKWGREILMASPKIMQLVSSELEFDSDQGSMFSCIDCPIQRGARVLTEPCTKAQFCIVWRKGYKSPIHLQCTCRPSSGSGSRRWRGRWEWERVSNPSDSTV